MCVAAMWRRAVTSCQRVCKQKVAPDADNSGSSGNSNSNTISNSSSSINTLSRRVLPDIGAGRTSEVVPDVEHDGQSSNVDGAVEHEEDQPTGKQIPISLDIIIHYINLPKMVKEVVLFYHLVCVKLAGHF